MQISYVFNKQDTWEICIRCFLDSDDVTIYHCDAKFEGLGVLDMLKVNWWVVFFSSSRVIWPHQGGLLWF